MTSFHHVCHMSFNLGRDLVSFLQILPKLSSLSYLVYLDQLFSIRGNCPLQRILDNVWIYFWLLQLGGCSWHLVGGGQECCYNILQCAGKLPTTRNYSAKKMSTVLRLRNPDLDLNFPILLPKWLTISSMVIVKR